MRNFWRFEKKASPSPADESFVKATRRQRLNCFSVFLRCVKQEEEEGPEVWRQVWRQLPRDLTYKIIFQHLPCPALLQHVQPDHLIEFPPIPNHALLVDKVVVHNFGSSTRRIGLPEDFNSPKALALSSLGVLVVAGKSSNSKTCLAYCHLPTSTNFSLISFPYRVEDVPMYAHVFHQSKLAPESFRLILVLRCMYVFDSVTSTWRWSKGLKTRQEKCTVACEKLFLFDFNSYSDVVIPQSFHLRSGVGVRRLVEPFTFVYFVCTSSEEEENAGVLSCMRVDTGRGEWEVMPGPSKSFLREVDLHHLRGIGADVHESLAVFLDETNKRLVVGFVEPWDWVLSSTIITLCEQENAQLVLPS